MLTVEEKGKRYHLTPWQRSGDFPTVLSPSYLNTFYTCIYLKLGNYSLLFATFVTFQH